MWQSHTAQYHIFILFGRYHLTVKQYKILQQDKKQNLSNSISAHYNKILIQEWTVYLSFHMATAQHLFHWRPVL